MEKNKSWEGCHARYKPFQYDNHNKKSYNHERNQKYKTCQNIYKKLEPVHHMNSRRSKGHGKSRNNNYSELASLMSINVSVPKKKNLNNKKKISPWSDEAQAEARKKQLSDIASKLMNKLKLWNTNKGDHGNSETDIGKEGNGQGDDASSALNKTQTTAATDKSWKDNSTSLKLNPSSKLKQATDNMCHNQIQKCHSNVTDNFQKNQIPLPKKHDRCIPHKATSHSVSAENKERKIQNLIGQLMTMRKDTLNKVLLNPKIHPKIELRMAQIVKENRLILAQKLRNLAESKINNQEHNACSQFVNDMGNLIDPDLAVDVCQLPPELIRQISDIFQLDYEDVKTDKLCSTSHETSIVENVENEPSTSEIDSTSGHNVGSYSELMLNCKKEVDNYNDNEVIHIKEEVDNYNDNEVIHIKEEVDIDNGNEVIHIKEEPDSEDSLLTCTFTEDDQDRFHIPPSEFNHDEFRNNESYESQVFSFMQNNDSVNMSVETQPCSTSENTIQNVGDIIGSEQPCEWSTDDKILVNSGRVYSHEKHSSSNSTHIHGRNSLLLSTNQVGLDNQVEDERVGTNSRCRKPSNDRPLIHVREESELMEHHFEDRKYDMKKISSEENGVASGTEIPTERVSAHQEIIRNCESGCNGSTVFGNSAEHRVTPEKTLMNENSMKMKTLCRQATGCSSEICTANFSRGNSRDKTVNSEIGSDFKSTGCQTELNLIELDYSPSSSKLSAAEARSLVKEVKLIDCLIHQLNQKRFMLFLKIVGLDSFKNDQNVLKTSLIEAITNSDNKLLRDFRKKSFGSNNFWNERKRKAEESKKGTKRKYNETNKLPHKKYRFTENGAGDSLNFPERYNQEAEFDSYGRPQERDLYSPSFDADKRESERDNRYSSSRRPHDSVAEDVRHSHKKTTPYEL